MRPAAFRLFAFVFILIGAGIFIAGTNLLLISNASKTWPSVRGRIDFSKVESRSEGGEF